MGLIWKNKYANMREPLPIMSVIIAAGGSGSRMGGIYKPMLSLCEKKAIVYSLEAFENSPYVKKIIISAKKENIDELKNVAEKAGITKLAGICEGGETRQDSVRKAFLTLFSKKEDITPFIAIHDAARPLIDTETINNAVKSAVKYGSAVCAVEVRDTVKRTEAAGFVTDSVDRNHLWQIQTPQIFDTDIYHTALSYATQKGINETDDSGLVSASGFKVYLHKSKAENIKITYPEDAYLAELILRDRKSRSRSDNA